MITLQGSKSSEDYGEKRRLAYRAVFGQLDDLYHDIAEGKLGETAKTSVFYLQRKAIKEKYPKP
jgi:hypothetical protein